MSGSTRLFTGEVLALMRRAWSLGLLSRKDMADLFGCCENTIYQYCRGIKREHRYSSFKEDRLKQRTYRIKRLLILGYSCKEISEHMNVNKDLVYRYKREMKKRNVIKD
mgnify:CR=1 FL=1